MAERDGFEPSVRTAVPRSHHPPRDVRAPSPEIATEALSRCEIAQNASSTFGIAGAESFADVQKGLALPWKESPVHGPGRNNPAAQRPLAPLIPSEPGLASISIHSWRSRLRALSRS
jgi:hypothetical protein